MKKKLFCLLLLLVLPVCLLFTGCDADIESKPQPEDEHLFVLVDSFGTTGGGYDCYVIVHKQTKIMYLVHYNGGATVMLDTDGKPMIYKGVI